VCLLSAALLCTWTKISPSLHYSHSQAIQLVLLLYSCSKAPASLSWLPVSHKRQLVASFSQGSTTVTLFFMVFLLIRLQRIRNSLARLVTNSYIPVFTIHTTSSFCLLWLPVIYRINYWKYHLSHLKLSTCRLPIISTALSATIKPSLSTQQSSYTFTYLHWFSQERVVSVSHSRTFLIRLWCGEVH